MPPQRSSSCSSLRTRSRGPAEVRASPARVGSPGLAGEVRQLVTALCASPDASACDLSYQGSDRGLRLAQSHATSRSALNSHFGALAERINAVIAGQQQQSEADRRRLALLERRIEARLDEALRESLRESDGREKWAELQGSVRGLIEETQAIARRLEGLDERLWTRTAGAEAEKQRHRDLEQQVQALDQQSRLQSASSDEVQKRQVARLCHVEHGLEEVVRRLGKCEEEHRANHGAQRHHSQLEVRLVAVERQQVHWAEKLNALQAQLEEGLRNAADGPSEDGLPEQGGRMDEALEAAERSVSSLEKRVSRQIEELQCSFASLRVKVEGHAQRVVGLAERMEGGAHGGVEAVRGELMQVRSKDRKEVDAEIAKLRAALNKVVEESDEVAAEAKEGWRQVHAQLAVLSLRSADAPAALRELEDRCAAQAREVADLRNLVSGLGPACLEPYVPNGDAAAHGQGQEELQRRLEWLEEQVTCLSASTDKADAKKLAQMQDRICDLVEQVSRLAQRAGSLESSCAALPQQLQALQAQLAQRQSEDAAPLRAVAELDGTCKAVCKAITDVEVRLREVEGSVQFSRERTGSPASRAEVARNSPERSEANGSLHELQGKLLEVANHLEAFDDLECRVQVLEQRVGIDAMLPDLPAGPASGGDSSGAGAAAGAAASAQRPGMLSSLPARQSRPADDGADSEGSFEADSM